MARTHTKRLHLPVTVGMYEAAEREATKQQVSMAEIGRQALAAFLHVAPEPPANTEAPE